MKFNLYASQYFKHLTCLMQSISQLSVILPCLCYVIIISYLALHCPNSPLIASMKLMADLANGGEEGGPVNKRARLESVVPIPAPAKKKSAAKGQPPTLPPRPVPPPALLWLSNQLPAPQRVRGSGRGSGPNRGNANQGPRGGGPIRGGTRGGSRGANAGQWGLPRGGQYGRWGRW